MIISPVREHALRAAAIRKEQQIREQLSDIRTGELSAVTRVNIQQLTAELCQLTIEYFHLHTECKMEESMRKALRNMQTSVHTLLARQALWAGVREIEVSPAWSSADVRVAVGKARVALRLKLPH